MSYFVFVQEQMKHTCNNISGGNITISFRFQDATGMVSGSAVAQQGVAAL